MNKYQKALNNLKEPTEEWLDKKLQLAENMDEPITFEHQSDINILQELVDKATPKKPLVKHYEEIGEKPYIKTCCPNGCRIQLSKATDRDYAHEHRFCNKCGQAIDWSEENE